MDGTSPSLNFHAQCCVSPCNQLQSSSALPTCLHLLISYLVRFLSSKQTSQGTVSSLQHDNLPGGFRHKKDVCSQSGDQNMLWVLELLLHVHQQVPVPCRGQESSRCLAYLNLGHSELWLSRPDEHIHGHQKQLRRTPCDFPSFSLMPPWCNCSRGDSRPEVIVIIKTNEVSGSAGA